jgi:hypothetical protein
MLLRVGLVILVAAVGWVAAQAQSAAVPTRRSSSGPFASDWAKPFPQTGGYIYNDPRTQPRRRGDRSTGPTCPAGTTYRPTTGVCR